MAVALVVAAVVEFAPAPWPMTPGSRWVYRDDGPENNGVSRYAGGALEGAEGVGGRLGAEAVDDSMRCTIKGFAQHEAEAPPTRGDLARQRSEPLLSDRGAPARMGKDGDRLRAARRGARARG
jgi:hypothetical protein